MPQHAHAHDDTVAMAEMLDLDGEVLHGYLTDVTTWIHEQTGVGHPGDGPRDILDVGAGTGTGALALAASFPAARVTAVDVSAALLHRLADKAGGLGVADRVHTVTADLDAGWPTLGPVDLAWASMSLHHMADPGRVLADIRSTLRPGGWLAVAEMDGFPTFLPDGVAGSGVAGSGVAGSGVEGRCHAAMSADLAGELPHLGADWAVALSRAGFTVEAKRQFVVDLPPPLPPAVGRYAQLTLQRLRGGVEGRVSADDLAALDDLTGDGPGGVRHRDDLHVRAARTVWLARRA